MNIFQWFKSKRDLIDSLSFANKVSQARLKESSDHYNEMISKQASINLLIRTNSNLRERIQYLEGSNDAKRDYIYKSRIERADELSDCASEVRKLKEQMDRERFIYSRALVSVSAGEKIYTAVMNAQVDYDNKK